MGIKPEYKEQLLAIVRKHITGCTVYLFGSRARDTNAPFSDIDIAIDVGHKADAFALSNIREDIENSNIPFFVDVLDFHTLDQEMKQTILKEGIAWKS
jgi:predicted nucleotidyltransferase